MPNPQQPELARSGRSEVTAEDAAATRAGAPLEDKGRTGKVPEANLPGHKPAVEQDKPLGRPPRPGSSRKAAPKRSDRQGATSRPQEPIVPAASVDADPSPRLPGGTATAAVLGTATGLIRRVPVVGGVVDKTLGRFLPDRDRPLS